MMLMNRVCVYVQESVEMRKMETSASSTIPAPGSGLENQGRAASMPRLNAELQVTPHLHHTCVCSSLSYMMKIHIIFSIMTFSLVFPVVKFNCICCICICSFDSFCVVLSCCEFKRRYTSVSQTVVHTCPCHCALE